MYYVHTSGNSSMTSQATSNASEPSEEYLYIVSQVKANLPHAKIKVSHCNIKVMLDTGATVNIIDKTTYQRLKHEPSHTKCMVPIFPYGSRTQLPAIGKFTSLVESKSRLTNATFHVLQGSNGSLLDYDTASQLELIKVANTLQTSPQQPVQPPTTSNRTEVNAVDDLLTEYAMGWANWMTFNSSCISGKITPPVTQPHRRVPFHVRKQTEAELCLEELDIIEKVDYMSRDPAQGSQISQDASNRQAEEHVNFVTVNAQGNDTG